MRWAGHVEHRGEMRNEYNILSEKPKRKSPLGKTRRRCEDNIRLDVREIGWEGLGWMQMAQDYTYPERALVNTAVNLQLP
jgi:hypothetical protein